MINLALPGVASDQTLRPGMVLKSPLRKRASFFLILSSDSAATPHLVNP
jgi:hypothetical protein